MAKRCATTIGSLGLRDVTLVLLVALALAATAAAPASATPVVSSMPAAFALSPVGAASALLLRGARGRVLHGAVRVRNVSGHAVTVILQPADIQNASNGNADYVTSHLSTPGGWLHLSAATVRLAPHAQRQVAFTVSVPGSAHGVSYYDGIVATDAADLAAAATRKRAKRPGFSFSRINRQALPLTIRLPGTLSRKLSLRSAQIAVEPAGAALVLGLLPEGSELIQGASVTLRVLRGAHTVFSYSSTLGQLFPSGPLSYRIAWKGRPDTGAYRVLGVIAPNDAAAVEIDRTVEFTAAKATRLLQVAPAPAARSSSSMPAWAWLALAIAVALLAALSLAVWKLARRPRSLSA